MSHHNANDYELAGRLPSQTFCDLRSASKARRRHRTNLEKYWSYRAVNPGQLGRAHHELPIPCHHPQELPPNTPVTAMTKQELYREAQRYPRPPTYHRKHPDVLYGTKTCRKEKQMRERRHAREALEEGLDEAGDAMHMACVTGTADDEMDLDDYIFSWGCNICGPESSNHDRDFDMFDCNGEAMGPLDDHWEMGVEKGFAGRAKIGSGFLQGVEDVRNWSRPQFGWCGWWNGDDEDWEVEQDEAGEDGGEDEVWSWAAVGSLKQELSGVEAEWEMLSSCSSWSEVLG